MNLVINIGITTFASMITEYDIEAKSNSEIIFELGARFRAYRLFCNLTQKEVAENAGVSIFTISQFEKGEARNIGLATILSLLRSIGFLGEVEKLLPPLPKLPSQMKDSRKKKERVRHK